MPTRCASTPTRARRRASSASRARAAPSGAPTWQGESSARWERATGPDGGGSLRVVTSNLRAGYLRKNGVPYSERATVSEHFDLAPLPDGGQLLLVTTIVEDPVYLKRAVRREPALQEGAGRLQMGSHAMLIDLVARSARRSVAVLRRRAWRRATASAQFDFAGSWAPLGDRGRAERLGAGGLPRAGAHRRGPHAGALLRRVAEVDDRAAVPGLGRVLRGARSLRPARVEPDRPGHEPRRVLHDRRVGRLERDDHLDGRPAAPVRARPPHAGGLHDRPVGGRRAGRAHDAHEGRLHPQDRCAAERPGDDRLAVLPPRRRADGPDGGDAIPSTSWSPRSSRRASGSRRRRSTSATRACRASRGANLATACPTSRRTRTRSSTSS